MKKAAIVPALIALLVLALAVSGCGTLGTIAYCVAVDNLQNYKCQ